MAELPINLQSSKFQPCFYEVDPMGIMNQIPELNPNQMENQTFNFNNFNPMSCFNENFFCNNQVSEFPGNLAETFPGLLHASQQNSTMLDTHGLDVVKDESVECKKRKVLDRQEGSSSTSSPVVSETGSNRKIGMGRAKKRKNGDKEGEKPKEVVHVRARRGQATDSHSLAERVRRGKINERLRCLQDIVPGCYKTMGMAVMLDEIINYVQSLQNQVEFLSMKLAAASTFYDFNSEADTVEAMQRAKANEAKELERLMRIGNGGQVQFQPTWRP